MRGEVRLTVFKGQVAVAPPGGGPERARPAGVELGEDGLSVVPEGGAPIELPYSDIEDLFDDNYTLRLTDFTGRRYELSMFGKAYGEISAKLTKLRRERLQRDLLLTGVGKVEAFPGAVFEGAEPVSKAELRLFDDLLVVMPERGPMWGIPYSYVDDVSWDEGRYQVRVTDDQGNVHAFGWLGKRSEEFLSNIRQRMDGLARRTARTLGALVPGLDPGTLSALAGLMRDGRAVQQRDVDGLDPEIWPRLEDAVVGTDDLRASYEALNAMTPAGWAAFGVKAAEGEKEDMPEVKFAAAGDREVSTGRESRSERRERLKAMEGLGLPGFEAMTGLAGARDIERRFAGARAAPGRAQGPLVADDAAGEAPGAGEAPTAAGPAEGATLWYFSPLARDGRPVNAVAQEVTSESGHATYVFRLIEPDRFTSLRGEELARAVTAGIARLNRALLTLNFRREPIYLPDDQIQEGRYTRYRVALRHLDYLRWAREAFLGRAIHTSPEAWRRQLEQAVSKA